MNTTVRFGASTWNIEFRGRDDPFKETRMQFVNVAAGNDEEVGAVADLADGRHHPAGGLHDLEISVLRLAESVIDDAARAFGERHHGTHAFDVGGKTAIHRQLCLADQLGSRVDRLGEIDILAFDLGARRREFPLEAGDRLAVAIIENLEPFVGALDRQVVGQRPAKRVGDVLEQF